MGQSNWVYLNNCHVIGDTDKAILVEYDDEEVWLPRSQIDDGDKYETGDADVTLAVTEFIAREKGLESNE